jgi:hypothetical protein
MFDFTIAVLLDNCSDPFSSVQAKNLNGELGTEWPRDHDYPSQIKDTRVDN